MTSTKKPDARKFILLLVSNGFWETHSHSVRNTHGEIRNCEIGNVQGEGGKPRGVTAVSPRRSLRRLRAVTAVRHTPPDFKNSMVLQWFGALRCIRLASDLVLVPFMGHKPAPDLRGQRLPKGHQFENLGF